MKSLYSLTMSLLLLLVSRPAYACAVCFSAKNDDNQIAYIATTGFLTFLPLIFAGGLILWVRRRARSIAQAEDRALPE